MNKFTMGLLTALTGILTLGTSMNAFGFLGLGNSATWNEEVLLHDGTIIIAERKQTYGSKPTLESRERALIEEEWIFPIPGGEKSVAWKTNFRNPPEGESLMLMLVGFIGGVPYLATSPAGCIAYNHWGRPNPPYVFFRHDGKQWQRISLAEFPTQLRESNVVVGRPDPKNRSGTLSVAVVKEDNSGLEPHHRAILREAIRPSCETLIPYGNGGWLSLDWFSGKSSLQECRQVCESRKVSQQNCPCDSLFKGE